MVEAERMAADVQGRCLEAGFPEFPTMGRAARAISHLAAYSESRTRR
jgi:acyl-CoA synthetase (NDP forming)